MTCKPGDLVLVPFPFSDFASSKKRPVLVLTFPDRYEDIIGLAVTSMPMQEVALPLEPSAMQQGTLPKLSWVRLDKVYTLDTALVIRNLGQVTPEFLSMVVQGLCHAVGWPANGRLPP